jgi:hypothetical protein
MISMVMSLHVRSADDRRVRLFFPVILAWLLALALLIVALPFVLIAALVTADRGPGIRLLGLYPAFFKFVFATSGILIDVKSQCREAQGRRSQGWRQPAHGKNKVFIAFY